MKIIKIIITVTVMISLISFCAYAGEESFSQEIIDEYTDDIFSSLDDDTKEILSQLGLDELNYDSVFDLSLGEIFSALKKSFTLQLEENLSLFFKILSMVLCLIILNTFRQGKDNELADDIFSLVMIIFVSSLISDCLRLMTSVFSITKGFMISLTPIITVLLSLSGNITFSALYSSSMIGFCQIISLISDEILIPLGGIYFAFIIAMNFNEITDAQKLSSHINGAVTAILGGLSTLFSLLLCAKNLIAKDADGILISSGKYLISSFIPIVGGAVSGVFNSIIGSISLVKSTVGIFAIIAFICIDLPLFIKLISCRLMLGTLSLFCSAFGENKITALINTLSQGLKLLGILAFFELVTVIISTGLAVGIRGNL